MNDNDIIKALECCANTNWIDECEGCPLYDTEKCINTVMQNALDLINRQKAEIERLTGELAISQTGYVSMEGHAWQLREQLKSAKSEAIKEFAERVDKILCLQIGPSKRLFWKIKEDIDNLVKEMVGESNA